MLGEPLVRLEEVDSTNRYALEWEDAPHGAAVVARAQSQGRGRLGRQWSSPKDEGLYLSIVLHSEDPQANAILSLKSALAVASAVQKLTRIKVCVKWPNDVLHVHKDGAAFKIGGILCEGRGSRVVVGVGLNLNQTREELPERPIFPASSLGVETNKKWQVEPFLQAILEELDRLLQAQWDDVLRDFMRQCYGLGDVVRVKAGVDTLIGIFESVAEDGALVLRTPEGVKPILAGDISFF